MTFTTDDGHPQLDLSPEVETAIGRLLMDLGPERIIQLSQRCKEVILSSGFGAVTLVFADRKLKRMTAETSYSLK